MTALTDADQDAGLRDRLEGLRIARDSFKHLAAENAIAADRYARENATLRARATAAEAEIERMKVMRKRLDHRIHMQRKAWRDTWEIVEMRMGVAARARDWRFGRKRHQEAKAAEDRATAAEDKLRDREAEIERLRGVLETIAAGEVMTFDEGLGFDVSFWMEEEEMSALARAALASTEPHASSEEASK